MEFDLSFPVTNFLVSALQLLDDSDYAMLKGMDAGSPMETIRKYFPETWIWDIVSVK